MDETFKDFTIENYSKLLDIAKNNFIFTLFNKIDLNKKIVVWRHDIDMSPHRALELASIEFKKNIQSTFFVWLHSPMYHFYEKDIVDIFKKILDLGHEIGLHFDPGFYGLLDEKQLDKQVNSEKIILEKVIGRKVSFLSYHNPGSDIVNGKDYSINELAVSYPHYFKSSICGLINAYGKEIRENFDYCSDSNGYWRFETLQNALDTSKSKIQKLHVLTHPEWWTLNPMSPRKRIQKCIDGRAKKNGVWYDKMLQEMGRENIR